MKTVSLSYFCLKFALQHFSKPAHELSREERRQVVAEAAAEQRLHQLILQAPEASQVIVDDETVSKAMEVVAGRYGERAEFLKDLESNELDEQGLRVALGEELVVGSVLELIGQRAEEVNEDEARAYYQQHAQKFIRPEYRTARQILITVTDSGSGGVGRENALERLSVIRDRLLKDPSRFGEEAAGGSECPSALKGGLLGTFPAGTLYPQLDQALFSLSETGISEIIESELGFHLLLCEAIEQERIFTWEEIGGQIVKNMEHQRRRRSIRAWVKELEKVA